MLEICIWKQGIILMAIIEAHWLKRSDFNKLYIYIYIGGRVCNHIILYKINKLVYKCHIEFT